MGQAADAALMFQRSVDFVERKFGLHHFLIPECLILRADALGQLGPGFVDERLSLLDRAVAIRELSIGVDKDSNAGRLSFVIGKIADCLEEANRLDEAAIQWAKCLAICTAVSERSPIFAKPALSCSVGVSSRLESAPRGQIVFLAIPLASRYRNSSFMGQSFGAEDAHTQLASARLESVKKRLNLNLTTVTTTSA